MSSRTPQLRQSFLVTGAAVALVLVTGFALLSSRSASRIVERQATARGGARATHVASRVALFRRGRRHEAEARAGSPAVVRAALEASQAALRQRLPQLDIPTLERMFNQRRELGGDPRSEEHTSELQSQSNLVCRLLLEKKKEKDCLRTLRPCHLSLRGSIN